MTRHSVKNAMIELMYLCCWVIIFTLLVFRQIPSSVAWDDLNYINYFFLPPFFPQTWSDMVFGEVAFRKATYAIGGFLTPIAGVRLLIALSVLPQIMLSLTLPRWGRWFFLTGYVTIGTLAMQLGFNQLRQGLALGLFSLAFLVGTRKWYAPIFAVVASTIHSSALLLASAWSIGLVSKRFIWGAMVVLLVVMLILSNDLAAIFVDSGGARAEMYAGSTSALNSVGIFANGIFLLLTCLSLSKNEKKDSVFFRSYLLYSATVFTLAVLPWSGAIAGRLFYYCRWMELYQIGRFSNSSRSKIFGVTYLVYGFLLTMWESYRSGGESYVNRVFDLFS